MFLKSLSMFIPEPLIVRHSVPYGPKLRRDEAIAAYSTVPLLGHEAGIEQDAEMQRDGLAAYLEMFRKRVDGAGGLDEEVEHPAPCRMADCCEDVGLAVANHHHPANIRKRLLARQAELSFAKGIGRAGPDSPTSACRCLTWFKFRCWLGGWKVVLPRKNCWLKSLARIRPMLLTRQ